MPSKKRDFRKAAIKKGFIEDKQGNHIFYRYKNSNGFIDAAIHTKVSHGGNGDISDSLLGEMQKQMKLDSREQLLHYIECSFSLEDYQKLLAAKNFKP